MCGCDVANGINVHFGCITNDAFGKMINSAAVDLLPQSQNVVSLMSVVYFPTHRIWVK